MIFEFLFKYSRELFETGELVLAGDWPRWVLLLSFAVIGLALTATLVSRDPALGRGRLIVIGTLQLAVLGIALLLVWQPSLMTTQLKAGDNVIAVMLDSSRSMSYGDGESSRLELAQVALEQGLVQSLREFWQVQPFFFADRAVASDAFDPLPEPGTQTRIGDALLDVLRRAGAVPLAAIVLVSDGGNNGGTLNGSQLDEIVSFGVPVHSVGVGREQIPEDLELAQLVLPEQALPGTRVAARIAVGHDGPGSTNIKIYDGGELIAAQQLLLDAETAATETTVEFVLTEPGQRQLRVSLAPISGERNLRNNSRSAIVDVPAERYRILYVEGEPRWEYKFLRRALDQDPTVRLASLLRVSANKIYRQGIEQPAELETGFPADEASLFEYHALIIGSIEAASFTEAQQEMMRDFVSVRGGSVLMLAGSSGLGAGGWGKSALGEALPTRLPDDATEFRRVAAPVFLTPLGQQSPVLQLDENADTNRQLWQELPPVASYQNIGQPRAAALTLLDANVDGALQPLLIMQPYGRGHTYILATAGTWRWQMRLPSDDQRHETFWRQLARALVANTPTRFQLSARNEGGRLTVQAELRNSAYEPRSDLEVTAIVSPESGDAATLPLRPSESRPGLFEGELELGESGLYVVEAIAYGPGNEPESAARVSLRHDAGQSEYFSLRQNRRLLERLAADTGGRYWTLTELANLPDALRYSGAGITERQLRPLWNAPAVFIILLCLKAIEWGLRRRWRRI